MELIELHAPGAQAQIAALGAEARSWRVGGVDLLWRPDARFWDATAPLLFPVCGWTREGRIRVAGRDHPLGVHGFARFQSFEVMGRGKDFARLVLRDNAGTRAQYPFAFELTVEYRLSVDSLRVEARVKNLGAESMPYAFGLHPGFRWPFAGGNKGEYVLHFDKPEKPEVPVIAPGGLFSARRRPVAFAGPKTLKLDEALFETEALCFLDCASRGLVFAAPGGKRLRVETDGFAHCVLWSRPGAPFLCVESWTGYGDPEDFSGGLADKPGMILLVPGQERRHRAEYSFQAG